MACAHSGSCPLLTGQMGFSAELVEIMRIRYCEGDWSSCARFMFMGVDGDVPADLFPTETERVAELRAS